MADSDTALENLAAIGKLKREPPLQAELDSLILSAARRLTDARRPDISSESRFDLAYNAAHALALAALRAKGYRSESRYLVFQCLQHTTSLEAAKWRVLDKAHTLRNLIEYQGDGDVDEALLEELLAIATELERIVRLLATPPA